MCACVCVYAVSILMKNRVHFQLPLLYILHATHSSPCTDQEALREQKEHKSNTNHETQMVRYNIMVAFQFVWIEYAYIRTCKFFTTHSVFHKLHEFFSFRRMATERRHNPQQQNTQGTSTTGEFIVHFYNSCSVSQLLVFLLTIFPTFFTPLCVFSHTLVVCRTHVGVVSRYICMYILLKFWLLCNNKCMM